MYIYIIIAIDRSILIGRRGDKARTSRVFLFFFFSAFAFTRDTRIRTEQIYVHLHARSTDARIHKNKSLTTARVLVKFSLVYPSHRSAKPSLKLRTGRSNRQGCFHFTERDWKEADLYATRV